MIIGPAPKQRCREAANKPHLKRESNEMLIPPWLSVSTNSWQTRFRSINDTFDRSHFSPKRRFGFARGSPAATTGSRSPRTRTRRPRSLGLRHGVSLCLPPQKICISATVTLLCRKCLDRAAALDLDRVQLLSQKVEAFEKE